MERDPEDCDSDLTLNLDFTFVHFTESEDPSP